MGDLFVWERLTRFSTTRNGPWFMIGDFNEITDHNEKEGGRQRTDSSFLPFKQMLSDCGMLEFPYTGDMLSWVGKRAGRVTVRCRLDRAVGNADWHDKFPHSTVKYMRLWGIGSSSDSCRYSQETNEKIKKIQI